MLFVLDPKPPKFEINGRNDKISRFVAFLVLGSLS